MEKFSFNSEEDLKEYCIGNIITLDDFEESQLKEYLEDQDYVVFKDRWKLDEYVYDDCDGYHFSDEEEMLDYVKREELIPEWFSSDSNELSGHRKQDVIDLIDKLRFDKGWEWIYNLLEAAS